MGEYIEKLLPYVLPYVLLFWSIISVRIILGFLSQIFNVRMKWTVDVSCILLFHIVGYIAGTTFLTILVSLISAFVIPVCYILLLYLYMILYTNLLYKNKNAFLKIIIMIIIPFLMFYNSFKNIDDLVKKESTADIMKKGSTVDNMKED